MRVEQCPICGKEFIVAPCNIYKVTVNGKVRHLCSWGCMLKLEQELEARKKSKEK